MIQIDMPMPNNCDECRFNTEYGFCKAMPDNFCGITDDRKRPKWCPLKKQEEEPNANGWISVKNRLPEKEGQYLCWFGKNTMAKGAAIATYLEMWKSFGKLESLETYPNVTHWMPIESPEEVGMNPWRLRPITDKQKKYIDGMQNYSPYPLPKFEGQTRGEAADYIDKYGKLAHESEWAIEHGYD